MSASPEFVTLCQTQVALTGQVLGAASTAVYLAENWRDQTLPELVPIATYPSPTAWPSPNANGLETEGVGALPAAQPRPNDRDQDSLGHTSRKLSVTGPEGDPATASPEDRNGDRVVIPLVHDTLVMGVLVSWRSDRPWHLQERHQLENIAQTLALACVMDQRGQWIQARLQDHRQDQTRQSERFHELLHQVRNPLTALRTFGKLLTKRLAPEDKNYSLAAGIVRESDRMENLLGYFDRTLRQGDAQLMAAADTHLPLLPAAAPPPTTDAEAGDSAGAAPLRPAQRIGGQLDLQPGDLTVWLPEWLGPLQILAAEQAMAFKLVLPPQLPPVMADPVALREVITTLLENAFKYAQASALVWVEAVPPSATTVDARYQGILVGDTGPGIPPEDQNHIFERQYRGVQAQGSIPGTGLGLAIVQGLVTAMAGQVKVYSPLGCWPHPLTVDLSPTERDRGTAFVVWLPLATTAPDAADSPRSPSTRGDRGESEGLKG